MSRSTLADRGEDKAAAIREALGEGNTQKALAVALYFRRSAGKDQYQHRTAEAMLLDTAMAARLLADTVTLADRRPVRPAGCPKVPGPADLKRVFETEFVNALRELNALEGGGTR
ncbi:MAG TPA: hypothetical protein VGG25_08235 [Streptosporangiaceae bacterium]